MKEFDIKQRTLSFSKELLHFVRRMDKTLESQILAKQIIRSGTSIGANVHESRGGISKKDFAHFFSIALKSANETDYWLDLIETMNPKLSSDVGVLRAELNEIIRVIAAIIIKTKKDA
jgi:four helix bundle protein